MNPQKGTAMGPMGSLGRQPHQALKQCGWELGEAVLTALGKSLGLMHLFWLNYP